MIIQYCDVKPNSCEQCACRGYDPEDEDYCMLANQRIRINDMYPSYLRDKYCPLVEKGTK